MSGGDSGNPCPHRSALYRATLLLALYRATSLSLFPRLLSRAFSPLPRLPYRSDTLAVGTSEETELYTVYSLPGETIEGDGAGEQPAFECEPLAVLDCPAQQGGIAFDAEDRIAVVGQQVRSFILIIPLGYAILPPTLSLLTQRSAGRDAL